MEWCEDQLLAEEGAPAHDLGVESPTGFAFSKPQNSKGKL